MQKIICRRRLLPSSAVIDLPFELTRYKSVRLVSIDGLLLLFRRLCSAYISNSKFLHQFPSLVCLSIRLKQDSYNLYEKLQSTDKMLDSAMIIRDLDIGFRLKPISGNDLPLPLPKNIAHLLKSDQKWHKNNHLGYIYQGSVQIIDTLCCIFPLLSSILNCKSNPYTTESIIILETNGSTVVECADMH